MKGRRAIVVALVACAAAVVLAPHELSAVHTAGDQARARWDRRIERASEPEPRLCGEDETPTDRDPCIGAHGRLEYERGRRAIR